MSQGAAANVSGWFQHANHEHADLPQRRRALVLDESVIAYFVNKKLQTPPSCPVHSSLGKNSVATPAAKTSDELQCTASEELHHSPVSPYNWMVPATQSGALPLTSGRPFIFCVFRTFSEPPGSKPLII